MHSFGGLAMFEIYKVVEGGPRPIKAEASAFGSLPTSAYRYCEPVRKASQFGIYVFLPERLSLIFEDGNFYWSLDDFDTRYYLSGAIQYPDFAARFAAHAPESAREYSPPFLTRTNDADIVQIWTGCFLRTPPGVAIWVRSPVNIRQHPAVHILEGVIDTEWWFGPLFVNMRFVKEGVPVSFDNNHPFIQVLPYSIPLEKQEQAPGALAVRGLADMGEAEWQRYVDTVPRRMQSDRVAEYALLARKARK